MIRRLALAVTAAIIAFSSVAEARDTSVRGYTRRDGTYVAPHMRSAPDRNPYNNFSTRGNVNPYTGEVGTVDPGQGRRNTLNFIDNSAMLKSFRDARESAARQRLLDLEIRNRELELQSRQRELQGPAPAAAPAFPDDWQPVNPGWGGNKAFPRSGPASRW